MIDSRQLKHVIALAEHHNFGRAADALNLTQPALTRSIQKLEEDLGVRLFDRHPRSVMPTAFGEMVLRHARKAIDEIDEVRHELAMMMGLRTGHVAFGAGPAVAHSFLGPVIGQFTTDHPGIRIRIVLGHWKTLEKRLHAGEIEFLTADLSDFTDDPQLVITKLKPVRFAFYCRRGHPILDLPNISLGQLMTYPLALIRIPPAHLKLMRNALASEGLDPGMLNQSLRVECNNFWTLASIVAASDLISAMPAPTLRQTKLSADYEEIPLTPPFYVRNWGIAHLAQRELSPAAQVLAATLKDAADTFE